MKQKTEPKESSSFRLFVVNLFFVQSNFFASPLIAKQKAMSRGFCDSRDFCISIKASKAAAATRCIVTSAYSSSSSAAYRYIGEYDGGGVGKEEGIRLLWRNVSE